MFNIFKRRKEQSNVKEEIFKPEISSQKECSYSETTEEYNDNNYSLISKMPYRAIIKTESWKLISQLSQAQCKAFQKPASCPDFYMPQEEFNKVILKANIKIQFERIEMCEKNMLTILDKLTTKKEFEENMFKSKIKELFEVDEELEKIILKDMDELMTLEEREKVILRQLDEFTTLEDFSKKHYKSEIIELFKEREEFEKIILRRMGYNTEDIEKIILESLDKITTLEECEKELLISKIKEQRKNNEEQVKFILLIFDKKTSIEEYEKNMLKLMIKEQMQKNEDRVNDILTRIDKIMTKEEFENKKAAEAAQKEAEEAKARRASARRPEEAKVSYRSYDPCDGCRCKYMAQAYIPHSFEANLNCEHIRMHSTVNADYYWCYKGGPPKDSSPGGWYSGRGY
jgi:hypothetical protein